ncbi:Na+/H+ antiporter NhaA [Puteibacter caeruleilacunae]|nr:Na+/H+ antiporter NhaA [Puteibacter caeruleilacunae]
MIQRLKEKRIFHRIKDPLVEFVRLEAFSGIVLMFFTILALIIANSIYGHEFIEYWEDKVGFKFGGWELSKTLLHWVNDGLMAIFFFVVGLEIKRELLSGGLSSMKKASLPIFAAFGGMLVPALIYVGINQGSAGSHGWGIPMATDIAFALGILILLGKRVPVSLKLLLTSIAIVDDIGAVIVIALYYTNEISWGYLMMGAVIYALLWGLNLLKVRKVPPYIYLGVLLWYVFLKSGVHATLAGILLAFAIPAKAYRNIGEFVDSNNSLLKNLTGKRDVPDTTPRDEHVQASVSAIQANCIEVMSPLQRLEHHLHPWVAYAIVPLFAFANAGVMIDTELMGQLTEPISLGIIMGLFLGKPIGITLFSFLGVKFGLAKKPDDVHWIQIIGVGLLGGIGFTMSFFVSQLAFTEVEFLRMAKFAVLMASVCSGFVGFWVLRLCCQSKKETE